MSEKTPEDLWEIPLPNPPIFEVSKTLSMSDFFVILQFFATASVIKIVETFDFHREYVL